VGVSRPIVSACVGNIRISVSQPYSIGDSSDAAFCGMSVLQQLVSQWFLTSKVSSSVLLLFNVVWYSCQVNF